MEKTTLTSVGGMTAAVLASLCCIGPPLAIFLGIGSIAALSVFEIYRPYLIGLSIVLVGVAFSSAYRKREIKCDDGTCRVEGASTWIKTGLWIVTILIGLAIGFPYFGFAPQPTVNLAVDSTAVVTLTIRGMDCKACAAGIEGSLATIQGVRKARVDFRRGNATVEYNGRTVTPETFVERVNESGFSATIEKGE